MMTKGFVRLVVGEKVYRIPWWVGEDRVSSWNENEDDEEEAQMWQRGGIRPLYGGWAAASICCMQVGHFGFLRNAK